MEKSSNKNGYTTVVLVLAFPLGTRVYAGPPLPTHNVEGNSGVFITSTAYLANPPEKGNVFGLPSVSGTFAAIGEKDFESVAVTENTGARSSWATPWNASGWEIGPPMSRRPRGYTLTTMRFCTI